MSHYLKTTYFCGAISKTFSSTLQVPPYFYLCAGTWKKKLIKGMLEEGLVRRGSPVWHRRICLCGQKNCEELLKVELFKEGYVTLTKFTFIRLTTFKCLRFANRGSGRCGRGWRFLSFNYPLIRFWFFDGSWWTLVSLSKNRRWWGTRIRYSWLVVLCCCERLWRLCCCSLDPLFE